MRGRLGLAGRLLAAQALVVLTGAVTLGVVAAAVGPSIFHKHLHLAGVHTSPEATDHVEQAYASASAIATGVGLAAALIAALAASAYVARRVAAPITALAEAAADIADGHTTVRVPAPGLGREFDTLATSFNTMAARMEAVEATRRRLLADLGHELRTPLATIEAYLDATEDGITVDDEDTMTVLRAQTARLRRLTDDLTAVTRAEEHRMPLRLAPTPPAALVTAAAAAARPRYAAKGVDLDTLVAAGLPDVDADPERMAQVLGNLLDNALRHTPPGGRVTVAAGGGPHGPAAADPMTRGPMTGGGSGGVWLAVSDTGDGIPPEHLPHLFERLYRADTARDRDHGGSGIGLAVVRAVVHAHGGRVTAASDGPGTGATFTVTLRACRQAPATGQR